MKIPNLINSGLRGLFLCVESKWDRDGTDKKAMIPFSDHFCSHSPLPSSHSHYTRPATECLTSPSFYSPYAPPLYLSIFPSTSDISDILGTLESYSEKISVLLKCYIKLSFYFHFIFAKNKSVNTRTNFRFPPQLTNPIHEYI